MAKDPPRHPISRQKRIRYWDCGYPCAVTHPSEAGAQRCIGLHLSRRRSEERLLRDQAIVRAILHGMQTAQAVEQFGLTQQGVHVVWQRELGRIGDLNTQGIACTRMADIYANRVSVLKLMKRRWRMDGKRQ